MPEAVAEEARPGVLVHVVGGVLLAAADLVDHHALLLGEALGGHGAAKALLGEQGEGLLDVVVEDLEVQRDVLVAGVGVVLAAQLGGAAVERHLVEGARPLEEHVLGHVGDAGMRAVEARAGAHHEGDRGERSGDRIVEDGEGAVLEAPRLAQAGAHRALVSPLPRAR